MESTLLSVKQGTAIVVDANIGHLHFEDLKKKGSNIEEIVTIKRDSIGTDATNEYMMIVGGNSVIKPKASLESIGEERSSINPAAQL